MSPPFRDFLGDKTCGVCFKNSKEAMIKYILILPSSHQINMMAP